MNGKQLKLIHNNFDGAAKQDIKFKGYKIPQNKLCGK
jgi:hypothetical protein